MIIIIAVFGGGGLWAVFTQISGAVIAQGVIGVESKVKTVQHLDGGIVKEIFVRDGDQVKAGDVLLNLDEKPLQANLNIVTNNLYELLASSARLEAERVGADSVTLPDELENNRTIPLVEKIINRSASLFTSRKNTRIGQTGMMRQKVVQLGDQIEGFEAQILSKKEQSAIVEATIRKKEPAAKAGDVSQDTIDRLKLQQIDLKGEVGSLQSDVARVGSTIAETELGILQIEVNFNEKVHSELREVSRKIQELREQKTTLEEKLGRTRIKSPVAGRVLEMSIHTIGGIVVPAKPILQIIPENDRLIIAARIQTTDIDQVYLGQETIVRLSAFDARTTPMLDARVTKVSAAQLVDAATNQPYFTLEIEILADQLSRLDENQILLPGMPTEIFIRTGERSPLDYLLKPLMVQIMRAFKEL